MYYFLWHVVINGYDNVTIMIIQHLYEVIRCSEISVKTG